MTPQQWLDNELFRCAKEAWQAAKLQDVNDVAMTMLLEYARAMAAYLSDEDICDIFDGEMPDEVLAQLPLDFDDEDS